MMIDTIKGAYCFLEAQIVRGAKTENRLPLFILKAFFYSFFINLIFCLPCFLSAGGRPAVIIIWIFFSLGLFSLILYRLIRLSVSKTRLEKMVESSRNASVLFTQSILSDIIFNLIFYSSIFIFILVYFSIIYGLCSLFISGSFLYFSVSLLVFVVFSGICLFALFLHFFVRDKNLLWPKIALPLSAFAFTLIFLFLIGFVFDLNNLTYYICSFSMGWWFTLPLLKRLLNDRKINAAYRFTVFLHAITVFIFLLSCIDVSILRRIPFVDIPFLSVIIDPACGIIISMKSAVRAGHFFFFLLPHLFIPVLLSLRILYDTVLHIMNTRRKHLFDEKTFGQPVFSSGLSLYPVIGKAFGFSAISIILFLEITPLADTLFSLAGTFKVVQVFNLTFLTGENIRFVLQLFYLAVIVVSGLRFVDSVITHLFSLFILFADELVYVEQRMLRRSILRIPLSRIHFTGFHQHTIQRLFDTGTIRIGSPEHQMPVAVSHIPLVREKFRVLLERIKRGI